jgi:hypothetical protein
MRASHPGFSRFLGRSYLDWAGPAAGLTADMTAAVQAFAPRAAADPYLLAFLAYCRHRALNDTAFIDDWREPWPALDDRLGAEAGLVNALVMLSMVPEMQEAFRTRGIPMSVARDTVDDFRRWMETDRYFQRERRYGITPWIARWLCHHWRARLVQLGRLQFSPGVFRGPLRAFRNRSSGRLVALSLGGIRFRDDGAAWGPCCGDAAAGWVSLLEEDGRQVRGIRIDPRGFASQETVSLPRDTWAEVLSPGDGMTTFHVPTGSPLDFEACGDSFRRAMELVPRFYPETISRGLVSGSWLLDPRLDGLLGEETNIVRLQRELYLYPGIQGGNGQYLERVFGWGVTDLRGVPRTTRLQRAVGDFIDAGQHFHGGFGFLLWPDVAWGMRPYHALASGPLTAAPATA